VFHLLFCVFVQFSFSAALRELREESGIDLQNDFPAIYRQVKQEPFKSYPVRKKIVDVRFPRSLRLRALPLTRRSIS
jgi:8-oxo-dGTP pyrophosphatase MutT (NUDIX family)